MSKSRKKKKSQIEENRDAKPKRREKVGVKRENSDALVIKTGRSDAELLDLGTVVRSMRCTRAIISLELKCDKEHMGVACKSLTKEVEVRALTQESFLKLKNLDEVTKEDELVTT